MTDSGTSTDSPDELAQAPATEEALRRQTFLARQLATVISEITSQIDDLPGCMQALCEKIRMVLGVDGATVVIEESGSPLRRFQVGLPDSIAVIPPFHPATSLQPLKAALQQGFISDDLLENEFPGRDFYLSAGVRSAALIPVLWKGDLIGVLTAITLDRPHAYLKDERRWLRTVAGHLGQAITNRQLLSALRSSEARYRQIVSSSLEGVWTLNLEGLTTFVNPQLAAIFGINPEEMIGRSPSDFVNPADRAAVEEKLPPRPKGTAERHALRFRRLDGKHRWAVLSTCPLQDDDGKTVGTLVLVSDTTEQHELEARFRQAQKLEGLGVLAGGIAHDFNNLLVGVLGNISLVLQDLPSDSPSVPSLLAASGAARRAADLTQQMLTYAGKTRVVTQKCSLNQIIREMTDLVNSAISRQATIRYEFADALPMISAETSQIRQVILNLLTNASDALQERPGAIRVTTGSGFFSREQLRNPWLEEELPDGPYVWLEVADTGCGMSGATLERIFDPFFTTRFTGRGLGLSAVLGILRCHHSAILVASELHRGSTFRVFFPTDPDAAPSPAPPPTPKTEPAPVRTILVVDDEDLVRNVARRVLERSGHRVIEATNGKEALSLLEALPPAAILLLDLTMPGMSGEEVHKRVLEVRPDLRVILTSGFSEQEATERFADHIAGFLQKPWTPNELLRILPRD